MKRITLALAILFALGLTVQTAWAGNAHFVGTPTITSSGSTATVSGKVAGLGNITQISVIVTAEAACVNPGTHKPKAANKQTVTAAEQRADGQAEDVHGGTLAIRTGGRVPPVIGGIVDRARDPGLEAQSRAAG